MCTYHLLQYKHKNKVTFPKLPVLHIIYFLQKHKHRHKVMLPKFPVLHVYIPSTKTLTYTQRLFAKISSLMCVHTLYNNKNIKINSRFQNAQSCIFMYSIQQHKHKNLTKKAPSMNTSKCPSTVLVHVPGGIPYTAPSILPSNILFLEAWSISSICL